MISFKEINATPHSLRVGASRGRVVSFWIALVLAVAFLPSCSPPDAKDFSSRKRPEAQAPENAREQDAASNSSGTKSTDNPEAEQILESDFAEQPVSVGGAYLTLSCAYGLPEGNDAVLDSIDCTIESTKASQVLALEPGDLKIYSSINGELEAVPADRITLLSPNRLLIQIEPKSLDSTATTKIAASLKIGDEQAPLLSSVKGQAPRLFQGQGLVDKVIGKGDLRKSGNCTELAQTIPSGETVDINITFAKEALVSIDFFDVCGVDASANPAGATLIGPQQNALTSLTRFPARPLIKAHERNFFRNLTVPEGTLTIRLFANYLDEGQAIHDDFYLGALGIRSSQSFHFETGVNDPQYQSN